MQCEHAGLLSDDRQLRQRPGSQGPLTRWEAGRLAEAAVADLLFVAGFVVLGRNVRLGPLELDIVARKGRLLAIVEVRTRAAGSWLRAFESVTLEKRRRLRRAAGLLWGRSSLRFGQVDRVRIDVAAVSFDGRNTSVEYLPGAVS